MRRIFLAGAILVAACSSSEQPIPNGQASTGMAHEPADPRDFVGKLFSDLVAERREFLIRNRAMNRTALGIFSEADGIEMPGQIRRIGGRDVLLFFTCRRDRCSTASNIILVDLKNNSMEVANWSEGQFVMIVDGPPDMADFIRRKCRGTTCETSDSD